MKRIFLLLTVHCLLLIAPGCCPLARPARTFLDSVGAEYLDYVEADAELDDDARRIRRQHVASFRHAIEEAFK